jgi:hypothetical protein
MKKVLFAVVAAGVLASAPVAADPVISGKYIVTITKYCQLVGTYNFATTNATGDYVNAINTSGSNFKQSMLLATFSPAKGTVSIDGIDDGGDIEIFKFTGVENNQFGNPIAQTPNSGKVDYSNTATSLTISGQTYSALYGQVNKKGAAGYVAFEGAFQNESGLLCTEQGVAQAQ